MVLGSCGMQSKCPGYWRSGVLPRRPDAEITSFVGGRKKRCVILIPHLGNGDAHFSVKCETDSGSRPPLRYCFPACQWWVTRCGWLDEWVTSFTGRAPPQISQP